MKIDGGCAFVYCCMYWLSNSLFHAAQLTFVKKVAVIKQETKERFYACISYKYEVCLNSIITYGFCSCLLKYTKCVEMQKLLLVKFLSSHIGQNFSLDYMGIVVTKCTSYLRLSTGEFFVRRYVYSEVFPRKNVLSKALQDKCHVNGYGRSQNLRKCFAWIFNSYEIHCTKCSENLIGSQIGKLCL